MTRNKLLAGLIVLVVVFLAGFLPQYFELRTVRADLAQAKEANALAELRDLAGYLMLETNQKNYGTASGYATRFFNRVREVHDEIADPQVKQSLADIMAMRDQVTAGLAQGDPAVVAPVHEIFRKVQSSARLQPASTP